MNNARRTALNRIKGRLDDIRIELEEQKDLLDNVHEEEQEAFDNLPESLQESERGGTMQEALDSLEEILENLDSCASEIEDAVSTIEEIVG